MADHIFLIIFILMIGIFFIHSEVKEIRKDMQTQSARIDKLYQMFIDLLKNK